MTATNHVVTGAVFASFVHEPTIALPAAFLLHFVLDILPHYGHKDDEPPEKSYERLRIMMPLDAAVSAGILLTIALARPEHWLVMVLAGILCASPDLMWVAKFVRHLRGQKAVAQTNWLMRFHYWIQWCERGWGGYVEVVWFIAFGWLLWQRLV